MPLYGGGNKNKRKGTQRGKGNEQKKGVKGIAAQYIPRNKAIKRLQVSLKDFRRLCILKGIYPRDPRKKKEGKDKTYYHLKDIQYLHHEPLLIKFRELKIFLKKYKKAQSKHDRTRVALLEENRPVFTLSHLIKERYPTFQDALRDLDDPLSMCALFSLLPSSITPGKTQHTPEKAFDCEKLCNEFQSIVIHQHALRKVFISIKGIYYQAKIQGNDITWLVPHQFTQVLPEDVDYRVMLTFLQFYSELLRFMNLKLYHDQGLQYPPVLDQGKYEKRAGLKSLQIQTKGKDAPAVPTSAKTVVADEKKSSAMDTSVDQATKKALQKSVAQVVSKLNSKKGKKGGKKEEESKQQEDEDVEMKDEEEAAAVDDFAHLTGTDAESASNKTPEEQDAYNAARVFSGCTFLLSREVPHHALEFVILCGGGKVESERDLTPAEVKSSRFTHQIIDRPAVQGEAISTREYVQPQYVFDSFNMYTLAPAAVYKPGVIPPPHLSPFVKEETVEELDAMHEASRDTIYIPKQREVLQEWGAKASWLRKKQRGAFEAEERDALSAVEKRDSSSAQNGADDDDDEDDLEAEEARHAAEIALERKGTSASAHEAAKQEKKQAVSTKKGGKKSTPVAASAKVESKEQEEADDDEEEEEVADDSDGEGEIVPDSEDDDEEGEDGAMEDEEEPTPASAPASRKRKASVTPDMNDPQELAKAMMTKKDKRLHSRMMYGIDKKKAVVDKLHEKREQNEKEETQQAKKKQKTSTGKKK